MLKFNFKINELNKNLKLNEIKKKTYKFYKCKFCTKYVNKYIENSFEIAIKLLKKNKNLSLINGPINKKKFLKNKYFGITEYLGSKTGSLKK